MILSIAGTTGTGVPNGMDLSSRLDRIGTFDIEAAIGKRIDTSHFFLMDTLPSSVQIPDRAEIVIYDVPSNLLSYISNVLGDAPAQYYRLNDTGSTARDWTGQGGTGNLNGTITKGVTGQTNDGSTAMTFDGSTGFIDVPAPLWNPTGNNPFSIEAIWTPGVVDATFRRICGREATSNHGVMLAWQSASHYYFGRGDAAAGIDTCGGGAPTVGVRAHLIGTYDGVNMRLYLNGVLVTGPQASSRLVDVAGATLRMGGTQGSGTNGQGTGQDMVFYNYCLTPGQVATRFALISTSLADPQVTDPTWAISAYNTFVRGAGNELTSATPANWTPRLFGGYVATPEYTLDGAQRYIEVSSQDYTTRLRTTVTNMAFAAGNSDKSIIQQLFARYRPDYNTANVNIVTASFPAITYPVHTLEQCLERIIKVSRGYYRADYYKQLWYGIVGQQTAPFNLSDHPNNGIQNLLANADFETGTLAGWTNGGAVIDPFNDFDGTYTARISAATYSYILQVLTLAVGTYTVSTWVMTSSDYAPSGTGGISIEAGTGTGTNLGTAGITPTVPKAGMGWTRIKKSFTVTAPGTFNILLCNTYGGTCVGSIWFNNAQAEIGAVMSAWSPTWTGLSSFPTENIKYTPDGSGLANRVWVIGSTYLSTQQDYQVPPALVNGSTYQFPLPGNPESTGMSITVGGVNQGTIGVAPGDGDTATPSSFKYNTLISHVPATVSFKTPPGSGVAVHIIGKFRYPLVQVVTDPALIAATNGVIFEAVVRDKRINDSSLAKAVGQAFLKNQGSTLKGGTCTIRTRQVGGVLLQPGHVVNIRNDALFRNIIRDAGGNLTTTAVVVVTQLRTKLDEDISQPYAVEVSFADRHVSGGY